MNKITNSTSDKKLKYLFDSMCMMDMLCRNNLVSYDLTLYCIDYSHWFIGLLACRTKYEE